ncbi:hypothetical protein A9Q99_18640 [Gammaproteobacteria bacterium 45_16_T64]|nr:hypothetical protein A9Q99_18640 [Gammaproteobacteria bacterium 45_16_T64]
MADILALVVDDSRMARYVLSKMLKEQGINVDTVESAEEALGYLCNTLPDMIFMDHTMPGMDGFQAIRAIKNDPKTASVPIMMYTSKEGEVYMNQARALGAVDVLPKQLKPVQLIQVLERQQLLPHQIGDKKLNISPPNTPKPVQVEAPTPIVNASDIGEDLEQVAKDAERSIENQSFTNEMKQLLDDHKEELSSKSNERTDRILESLDKKVDEVSASLATFIKETHDNSGIFRSLSDNVKMLFISINAILVVGLGALAFQQSLEIKQLTGKNHSLKEEISVEDAKAESAKSNLENELTDNLYKNQLHLDQWVANLQWALNRKNQFLWNEKPFNKTLASLLKSTADKLNTAGFKGSINLTSHLGQFCLVANEDGDSELPVDQQTLSECTINDINVQQAEHLGLEKSIQFGNFIAAFERQYDNNLHLSFNSAGLSSPTSEYPEKNPEFSAQKWNSIAQQNHRVEIEFMPLQLEE